MENKRLQSYALKAKNQTSLAFVLSVFICSEMKTINRKLVYFFYFGNYISHNEVKYNPDVLSDDYLLRVMFNRTANRKLLSKKMLRMLTGLEDRGTFNKYFDSHLRSLRLEKRRSYTLSESYDILRFWQDDHKWSNLAAFSKGELARRFTNGNYELLELIMTNEIMSYSQYFQNDYLKPSDLNEFFDKHSDKNKKVCAFSENYKIGYLAFYFFFFILNEYEPVLKRYFKQNKTFEQVISFIR